MFVTDSYKYNTNDPCVRLRMMILLLSIRVEQYFTLNRLGRPVFAGTWAVICNQLTRSMSPKFVDKFAVQTILRYHHDVSR